MERSEILGRHPDILTAWQLASVAGDGFTTITVGQHRVRWSKGKRTIVLQELGSEDRTRWQLTRIEAATRNTCEVEESAELHSIAQLQAAIAWAKEAT